MIGIVHVIHEKLVKQLVPRARDAGRNCTMAAAAMAGYRQTLGKKLLTAQRLRDLTGDHVGGTNLDQAKYALARAGIVGMYGPFRGMGILTFYSNLRTRGAVVQGSAIATYGTKWRGSFTFRGNHAWYAARGKGYVNGRPAYVLVYDPLADGRRAGIAKSPFWLPRSVFEKFLAYLRFTSVETLGYGRAYALFTKATIPHRHNTAGGVAVTRRTFALKTGYTIRTRPGKTIIRRTRSTDRFDAWQRVPNGPLKHGSRVWWGDHSGTRWIHDSARR